MNPLPPETTVVLLCPPSGSFPGLNLDGAAWMPLAGRPLVYRALDLWAERRAAKVVVVRPVSQAKRFQESLKKGEAWGIKVEYADFGPETAASVSALAPFAAPDRHWAGGSVERWPLGDLPAVAPGCQILVSNDSEVPLGWFLAGPEAANHPEQAAVAFTQGGTLAASTGLESLAALRVILESRHPALVVSAEERKPGLFFSAKVKLGEGVQLVPPVFLGEGCRIGDGSVVGPNVSLEEGTLVGKDCLVQDSIVMGRPVLGDHLDIRSLIIQGDVLLNCKTNAFHTIADPSLIRPR